MDIGGEAPPAREQNLVDFVSISFDVASGSLPLIPPTATQTPYQSLWNKTYNGLVHEYRSSFGFAIVDFGWPSSRAPNQKPTFGFHMMVTILVLGSFYLSLHAADDYLSSQVTSAQSLSG